MIIALHAVLGHVGLFEAWTYSEMREVTLHPVVEIALLGLAVALGPVPFPAEVKAILVAADAVAAFFGAAWLLIQRVLGMARVI